MTFGADVPAATVGGMVREHAPSVVTFVATTRAALASLPAAVREVVRSEASPGVIVWGHGVRSDILEGCSTTVTTSVSGVLANADVLAQRPSLN